jgi:hypothetical protein
MTKRNPGASFLDNVALAREVAPNLVGADLSSEYADSKLFDLVIEFAGGYQHDNDAEKNGPHGVDHTDYCTHVVAALELGVALGFLLRPAAVAGGTR